MLYQTFREQMPYCVYYYFNTNLVVVKNRDYQPIYEGEVGEGVNCESAFRVFSCPLPDCYRNCEEYLQSYLYDDDKQPIFNKKGSRNVSRMDKYLERKERLWQFLVDNVRATKSSFMH